MSADALLPFIAEVFDQMPFNRLLGLKVTGFSAEQAEVRFAFKAELVGNPVQQILHGGVIASVLDTVGGIMAISSALKRLGQVEHEVLVAKMHSGLTNCSSLAKTSCLTPSSSKTASMTQSQSAKAE